VAWVKKQLRRIFEESARAELVVMDPHRRVLISHHHPVAFCWHIHSIYVSPPACDIDRRLLCPGRSAGIIRERENAADSVFARQPSYVSMLFSAVHSCSKIDRLAVRASGAYIINNKAIELVLLANVAMRRDLPCVLMGRARWAVWCKLTLANALAVGSSEEVCPNHLRQSVVLRVRTTQP
jgi:hypothetical protein